MDGERLLELLNSGDPALVRQGVELALIVADPARIDHLLAPAAWEGDGFSPFVSEWRVSPRAAELLMRLAPAGSREAARLRGEVQEMTIDLEDPEHWPLDELARLPNLAGLAIEGAREVRGVAALAGLALRRLELRGCAGLDAPLGSLPRLEELRLTEVPLADLGGLRAPALRRARVFEPPGPFTFRGEPLEEAWIGGDPARFRGLGTLSRLLRFHAYPLRGPLPALPPSVRRLAVRGLDPTLEIAGLPRLEGLWIAHESRIDRVRLGGGLPRLAEISIDEPIPEPIAGLEGLPALRSLWLKDQPIQDLSALAGVEALAWTSWASSDLPRLPLRLRRLRLELKSWPDPLPLPETLEELSIGGPELAAVPPLPRLRRLVLRKELLGLKGFDWRPLARFPALEELALRDWFTEVPEPIARRVAVRRGESEVRW